MAPLRDLIGRLDAVLKPGDFADYGPNGLQVPGPAEIGTVVTGVSANADLFAAAAREDADLVLVHHGLFWKGQPLEITPVLHRRLGLLYEHDIALAAYHLPLDAHPEHGNNALLARALGVTDVEPFAGIGVRGRLGVPAAELAARVREAVGGREPLVVAAGPDHVDTVAIVTGAATDHVADALALGLDAFITGEPAERGFSMARDGGIHFVAAGHHATETFGVKALGELLAAEFGVRHVFVDIENPI